MKKEKYKQMEEMMFSYKRAYHEMDKLCMRIIKDMKKQIWITSLLCVLWLVSGIFWGLSLARWLTGR